MQPKKRKRHRIRHLIRKDDKMARSKKNLTLDERIEKAKTAVFQAKDRYDAAVEELSVLQKKKQELQRQELLQAIETSPRSYEEIIEFLSGKKDPDEE